MCDAASITLGVMMAAASTAQFIQSDQQASAQAAYENQKAQMQNDLMIQNAEMAQKAAVDEYDQENLKLAQEQEAKSQELQNIQKEKMEAMGAAIASGNKNISALTADFERQEASYKEAVRRNFDLTQLQVDYEKKATQAETLSRINSVSPYIAAPVVGPSGFGLAANLGMAAAQGYGNHQRVEMMKKWKVS